MLGPPFAVASAGRAKAKRLKAEGAEDNGLGPSVLAQGQRIETRGSKLRDQCTEGSTSRGQGHGVPRDPMPEGPMPGGGRCRGAQSQGALPSGWGTACCFKPYGHNALNFDLKDAKK